MPIKLNSSTLQISRKKQAAKKIVDQILDENMEYLMNTYMIPELRSVALAANIPDGFIIGIKFIRTGTNGGDIINTWGTEEKPLALWFNYGTRDHGALGNWPLHWKDKITGKDIYAKYVRGIPKTEAMEAGIAIGTKKLIEAVPSFVEARLE